MTDDELNSLIQTLKQAKVRPDKMSSEWAYHRAWNDGIDYALNRINIIKGESHGSDHRA